MEKTWKNDDSTIIQLIQEVTKAQNNIQRTAGVISVNAALCDSIRKRLTNDTKEKITADLEEHLDDSQDFWRIFCTKRFQTLKVELSWKVEGLSLLRLT